MKKLNLALALLLTVFVSQKTSAELYFEDTFNNSNGKTLNDVEINGRQFGTKSPLSEFATPDAAWTFPIENETAIIALSNGVSIQPTCNFTDSLTFNYECDFTIPVPITGAEQYVSLALFKTINHQFAWDGLAIRFQRNGSYQLFKGDLTLGQIWVYSSPAGAFDASGTVHAKICARAEDFTGSKVSISLYINDKPQKLVPDSHGNVFEFVYTLFDAPNCNNNFIVFGTYHGGVGGVVSTATFDNVKIYPTKSGLITKSWTSNSDTEINSSKTYTHKININANADVDINGVTFNYATNGQVGSVDWKLFDAIGYDIISFKDNTQADSIEAITGSGTNLLLGFAENKMDGATGDWSNDIGIYLTNLTPNSQNILNVYSAMMGGSTGQQRTMDASDSANGAITFLNQAEFPKGTGHIIRLTYIVPESGDLYFTLSPTNEITVGGGWTPRIFAFSNEEVDAPTTPTTQASAFIFSSVDKDQMTISLTRGDGNGVIVVANESSSPDFIPENNVKNIANSNYRNGERVGSRIVYDGTESSFDLTGLTPGREYFLKAFEYSETDLARNYLTISPVAASQKTMTTLDADIVSGGGFEAEGDTFFNWAHNGDSWENSGSQIEKLVTNGFIWFNAPGPYERQCFTGIKLEPNTKYTVSFDAFTWDAYHVSNSYTVDVGLKYMSGSHYESEVVGEIDGLDVLSFSNDITFVAIPTWAAAGRFTCPYDPANTDPKISHFFSFETPGVLSASATNDIGVSVENGSGVQIRLDNVKVEVELIPEPAFIGLLILLGAIIKTRSKF